MFGVFIKRPVYQKIWSSGIFRVTYFNTSTREFILKDTTSSRMHVRRSALDATKLSFNSSPEQWMFDESVIEYLLSIGVDHIEEIPGEFCTKKD